MSSWGDMMRRASGEVIRTEDQIHVSDNANLSKGELSVIESFLKKLYAALEDCTVLSVKGFGTSVELSEMRKTYLEYFADHKLLPENSDEREKIEKEIKAFRVLGEYKDGEIILYINNIIDCANEQGAPGIDGKPYLTVTRYVYLHELMHAFYDKGKKYDKKTEQEEGLAEFGALLLLDELVNLPKRIFLSSEDKYASQEELDWAVCHVEGKKGALECYARGAYLFKLFGQDKDLSKRMLEAYPKPL